MKRLLVLLVVFCPLCVWGQFNARSALAMGRTALFYEDYAVALQYFTRSVNAKPYLAEGYYYRALAKFYLADYSGAESDATLAAAANPYIPNLFPLRAICRVRLHRYAAAEADYRRILARRPDDADSWHNLVMCQIEQGAFARAAASRAAMRDRGVEDRTGETRDTTSWARFGDFLQDERKSAVLFRPSSPVVFPNKDKGAGK